MKLKILVFVQLSDAGSFHRASSIPERFNRPNDAASSRENYFGVRYTECQVKGSSDRSVQRVRGKVIESLKRQQSFIAREFQ